MTWKGRLLLALTLVLELAVLSCGGPGKPPATTPDEAGYDHLRDLLGDFDFRPLAGRVIVLDPGHGGSFKGAIGPGGLTEAEVNLGVALYLRGLLEWAGAEVHLTRTADHDLLAPPDTSLADDLAARMALVDSLRPDVFVSIHHNSNAERDSTRNEIQTYYPFGREGADLDLARAIHKYLVRNLGIASARILPGNFYVLRNCSAVAVLGEPSMISHPGVEEKLKLAAKQELEAKAYFLGLREYFALGTPSWVVVTPGSPTDGLQPGDAGEAASPAASPGPPAGPTRNVGLQSTAPAWRFEPGEGGPALDPATVSLLVDGRLQPLSCDPDGRLIAWNPPQDLRQGTHHYRLYGRNLGGRATPVLEGTWSAPPSLVLTGSLISEPARPGTEPLALLDYTSHTSPLDSLAPLRLVAAGAAEGERTGHEAGAARTGGTAGRAVEIALPSYPGYRGWLLLAASTLADSPEVRIESGAGISVPVALAREVLPPGWSWQMILPEPSTWTAPVPGGGWSRRWPPAGDPPHGPLPDPTRPALAVHTGQPLWLEAPGAFPLLLPEDDQVSSAAAAAAVNAPAGPDTLRWRPILPALRGVVIVLDPGGGGSDAEGFCPLGTRGADLNLAVAERTAELLRGAGAEVVLTRRGETWQPPEEKVRLANRAQAALFLTIARTDSGSTCCTVQHHPGSATGQRWAQLVGGLLDGLAADSVAVMAAADYLLRQTACPALRVTLPLPQDAETEDRLTDPSHQQALACSLLLATAALLGGEDLLASAFDPAAFVTANRDRCPALESVDWIRLDGNLLWLPPRWQPELGHAGAGTISSRQGPRLPAAADRHTLEIQAAGRWQLWTLRRQAGGDWSGRLFLAGG
jgi:N-acetylmuramoyl-L-alanine amidase